LRSNRFEKPQLFVRESRELSLSNQALIDLLCAVLDKGFSFKFRTKGNSMVPFIKEGDIITVSPLLTKKPRLGEVVAFVHPDTGKLIVHRIIKEQTKGFLIQGDGVIDHADSQVPPECVLGRVTCIERNGTQTHLGLGFERVSIAWLVRLRLLIRFRKLFAFLNGSFNR